MLSHKQTTPLTDHVVFTARPVERVRKPINCENGSVPDVRKVSDWFVSRLLVDLSVGEAPQVHVFVHENA